MIYSCNLQYIYIIIVVMILFLFGNKKIKILSFVLKYNNHHYKIHLYIMGFKTGRIMDCSVCLLPQTSPLNKVRSCQKRHMDEIPR